MSKHIRSILVITVICAVVSLSLAVTHHITAPIIEEQEKLKVVEALGVVFPDNEGFEPDAIDLSKYELPDTVTEAYKEKSGGFVIKLSVSGYQPNMIILCGVNKDGIVTGATCISSGETLGEEKTYGDNFIGKSADDYSTVDTVANATYTTNAYKNAIKDALNAATVLSGGTADLRTEDEILNDNLSVALPEAGGKFDSVVLLETFENIDGVYYALNNQGYVFVCGKNFVATDASGKVIGEVDATLKATVENAASKILEWEKSKIDLSSFATMPTSVKHAYKNADGTFTFIVHGAGYGINGGDKYHPASGKPIVIKVVASKSGQIVSCITLEQSETANLGSACGEEAFYSQFNGKTEENYSNIDAISGATITTNGYKNAIGDVFTAIKLLKGVS